MCSAVVGLPEPPFSLPITSTWARPADRAAWVWAMLGLGAGWKCALIFLRPQLRGPLRPVRWGEREGTIWQPGEGEVDSFDALEASPLVRHHLPSPLLRNGSLPLPRFAAERTLSKK